MSDSGHRIMLMESVGQEFGKWTAWKADSAPSCLGPQRGGLRGWGPLKTPSPKQLSLGGADWRPGLPATVPTLDLALQLGFLAAW